MVWPTSTTCTVPDTLLRSSFTSVFSLERIRSTAASVIDGLSAAQRRAFQHAAASAKDGSLTFITLGGSVIAGATACKDKSTLSGPECAYPTRFADWLRKCSHAPDTLFFDNRAISGTSIAGVLPQLPSLLRLFGSTRGNGRRDADLLLLDFSANDFHAPRTGLDGGDIINVTDVNATAAAVAEDIASATEVALRYVLSRHPGTAVLLMDGSCCVALRYGSITGRCHSPMKQLYAAAKQARVKVAQAYGVGYVAYHDLLAGECTNRQYRAKFAHPDSSTHQRMSEALSLWWAHLDAVLLAPRAVVKAVVSSETPHRVRLPPPITSHFNEFDIVCQDPLRVYDPRAPAANEPMGAPGVRVVAGGADSWKLYADRVGKPGWITTGPVGSTLEMDLAFGRIPRVTLVFDQSYEGFGKVEATLYNRTSRRTHHAPTGYYRADGRASREPLQVLEGMRRDGQNVTQTSVITFNVNQPYLGWSTTGFGIPPFAEKLSLRLTLASEGKFKLRYVSSC